MHAPHQLHRLASLPPWPALSCACRGVGRRIHTPASPSPSSRWPPSRHRLIAVSSSPSLISRSPRLLSLVSDDCVFMGNTPSCIHLAVAPAGGGGRASPSSSAAATNTTSTKVIHADGTVTRLARPVRASELMHDHPGQFVCDARRLTVGCRVPGVGADEVLQPRHACYFLLPMDMLYSVLTDEEMAALSGSHAATAAASAWKRISIATAGGRERRHGHRRGHAKDEDCSDGARVYPMLGLLENGDLGADNSRRELRTGGPAAAGNKSSGGAGKYSGGGAGLRRHRSWQPVLDTIEEAP